LIEDLPKEVELVVSSLNLKSSVVVLTVNSINDIISVGGFPRIANTKSLSEFIGSKRLVYRQLAAIFLYMPIIDYFSEPLSATVNLDPTAIILVNGSFSNHWVLPGISILSPLH